MWAIIPSPVRRALIWAATGLVALLAVIGVAKRDARRGADLAAEKAYRKTRERMDDAEDNLGDDPAAAQRWLRERGKP